MSLEEIKKEILSFINLDKEQLDIVNKEIEILSNTEGLDGKSNLESFYNIWKNNVNKKGDKNSINSWTAYYLNMTSKKPDGEFLPNRRAFARAGFPDIDMDFDDERRNEVYEYIIQRYGRDKVGNAGTYIAQKMKKAIKDVVRSVDATKSFFKGEKDFVTRNFELANAITNTLPVMATGVIKAKDAKGNSIFVKNLKQSYEILPDFKKFMDMYPEVYKHAIKTEGMIGSFGQHPAGIVISNVPLSDIAPLRKNKKGYATQFVYEDLEQLGLIKFDILSIAALTIIRDTCRLVKLNYNIDIDIENLDLEDKNTLNLYKTGKLYGVFQCETYGMQETMRNIEADRFDDVMAAVSLYRPGPMDSIPEYASRKKGISQVSYFHPSIKPYVEPILKNTFGILVYQEQVMAICNKLANFTISDGYSMIKAVGKKKQSLLEKYKKQFIEGCYQNGVEKDVSTSYWEKFITPFANYGFNKSHSCCYAYLSFQTAYLKANFTDEFVISFLNVYSKRNNWDRVEMMEQDAKKNMSIKFLDKKINLCDVFYSIEKKKDIASGLFNSEIRPGFMCKGVSEASASNIKKNAPYKNIEDLIIKTDQTVVTMDVIGSLIDAGFLKLNKEFKTKEEMLLHLSTIRKDMQKNNKKGIRSGDIFS